MVRKGTEDRSATIASPAESSKIVLTHNFHRIRVPLHSLSPLDAQITQQRRPGCAIAEHRIFDDRFARANRGEEVAEMTVAVAVSLGRNVFFESTRRWP